MERIGYVVLSAFAFVAVAVGALTTALPLGEFLVTSAAETASAFAGMVWITWWALVVGFAIAGGVEAWVSSDAISQHLEGEGVRELALGTFFGFVSSSCSYSAIATAKNLFKKGASAPASLGAFMFASTNLVIEIGFVIWLLLGWQFVVADFLGGLVLIALLALAFRYLVPDEVVEQARENVEDAGTATDPNCGMDVDVEETDYTKEVDGTTYYFCSKSCMEGWSPEDANTTIREQVTTLSGWRALANKQWKEWDMLWDEILIGFVFASILTGFVPDSVWTSLFGEPVFGLPVYLVWTAILGALVGILTFVCSVGNVPFGALLFTEGLPFGGVLSYIYADLIIPPIMQAYREYYGLHFAGILSGLIFAAAVVTGILMHVVFAAAGLIPPVSQVHVAEFSIELNYKAALNVFATALFLVLYYLHKTDASDDDGGHGHDDHSHTA
ncbi:permease [Halocalculus aciditolerans]|uniref:Membrane protein n=1 Tax=Halocalculus aciditolerans TaxID=1383812 RepID=A0A830FFG3_9EURY|nr:permease [Halocalculus aciditolerans]GGL70261.1 membrane protein [Halocalculus aciditolerans]